jgi:tetratricopeptide (TPR) repeat protein
MHQFALLSYSSGLREYNQAISTLNSVYLQMGNNLERSSLFTDSTIEFILFGGERFFENLHDLLRLPQIQAPFLNSIRSFRYVLKEDDGFDPSHHFLNASANKAYGDLCKLVFALGREPSYAQEAIMSYDKAIICYESVLDEPGDFRFDVEVTRKDILSMKLEVAQLYLLTERTSEGIDTLKDVLEDDRNGVLLQVKTLLATYTNKGADYIAVKKIESATRLYQRSDMLSFAFFPEHNLSIGNEYRLLLGKVQ